MGDYMNPDGYEEYEEHPEDDFRPVKPKIPLEEVLEHLMDSHHLEDVRDALQMKMELGIFACMAEAAPVAGPTMLTDVKAKISQLNIEIRAIHLENQNKLIDSGNYLQNVRDGGKRTAFGTMHPHPDVEDYWDYDYAPPPSGHPVRDVVKGFGLTQLANKTGIDLRKTAQDPYYDDYNPPPRRRPPPRSRRRRRPPPRYRGYR